MIRVKADLHIHTALSTHAEPDMCPGNIIERAKELKLNVIGITDYNSTKQAIAVKNVAMEAGILVLTGAEIISSEGVRVQVYFEQEAELASFQSFLDVHLPQVENNCSQNGYQIIFDEFDEIVGSENCLLETSLNCTLTVISKEVQKLNGIMIASGADRSEKSIFSEFGCIPKGIKIDAVELFRTTREKFLTANQDLKYYPFVRGSNAKDLKSIGNGCTIFNLSELSFNAFRQILSPNENHDIVII